jgi:hypothetical protein
MKKVIFSLCVITLTSPVLAQDEAPSWSVTVTPRYQQLLFLPTTEADGLESMPSYGGTITVRDPSSRFGITGTYMTGSAKGVYTYDDGGFTGDYGYNAKRRELALQLEFTPAQTGVTFIGGYHRFSARNNETLLDPGVGNGEVGDYRVSVNAAEVGLRIASRLGANSRHSVSAQFMGGVGSGRYKANVAETFGGVATTTNVTKKGTGYLGDVALGYNYFLTDNFSIGTRARGYVFGVSGGNTTFAVAPEINASIRF